MRMYYVIRHKPTQTLLPAAVLATHFDFDIPDGAREPRLFKSASAAKRCATAWAAGRWRQAVATESEGFEYPSYTYLSEPEPHAVEGRKRSDLEVVPVTLELLA